MWWNGIYLSDYSTGGSIDGTIRAVDAVIAMHQIKRSSCPVTVRREPRELTESRDMLVAIRVNVAALKAKGLPLEETIKCEADSSIRREWGQVRH